MEEKEINKKQCFYCKNDIEKGTIKCPFCNKNQIIHRVIILIIIFLMLSGIIILTVFSNEITTYNTYSLVTKNNVQYKITSVVRTKDGSKWMGSVKEENEFLIITLNIKNNKQEPIDFIGSDWVVINNNQMIEHNKYNNVGSVVDSKIDNTNEVTKVLIYEVPINSKLFLRFNSKDINNSYQYKLY